VVGLPLTSLTKEEVNVEKTIPLEGWVGVEDDEGSEVEVVVERDRNEVPTAVEKRVRESEVGVVEKSAV
jgi:hypothetical protein